MRTLAIALVLPVFIVCLSRGIAQDNPVRNPDDEHAEKMRVLFDFATWPGKNGPMKKGFIFRLGDYEVLTGYTVDRIIGDELNLDYLQYGAVRYIGLVKGENPLGNHMRIFLAVGHTSNENAHELLLRFGLPRSPGPLQWKLAHKGRLAIGDLSFSDEGVVCFVRNNVVCAIFGSAVLGPDIKALAAQIDARICALPNLTPAEFEASRPIITVFNPQKASIKSLGDTRRDESTALNITATDPGSETLKRILDDHAALSLDETVDPPTVAPGEATGAFPINLIVVNQSLQFRAAETAVTVTDGWSQVP